MCDRGAVIWLADTNGTAYTLSLEDNKLKLRSEESDIIKRISAVESCAFAVGGDQDVYLYVHTRDVPIRVQVITYENQRWGLLHKWSVGSMFPTDRWSWSTKDGGKHTPKSSFELPHNWEWESEWYIDSTVPGDEEGWQYALDFPRDYSPSKCWKSCVRRRCWARYRRFVTIGKWFKLPQPEREELVERAIQDLAAGGTSIPGCESGYIAVWAVNFAGQVLYRTGINSVCPKGKSWVTVELPEEVRAGQVSVGPTGMVWILSWQGTLYLRTGISKFQPMGMSWVSVESPKDERVYQLSVGVNAVWLLTMEGKVFFRRGVSSSIGYTDQANAQGTKWVEMVGSFSLLSMALNDQIFALSTGSDHVYFRSDVTSSELSGHEWKIIKIGASLTDSMSSLSSDSSHPELEGTRGEDGTLYSEQLLSMTDTSAEKLHWNWISCGSCDIMADFFTSNNKRQYFLSSTSTLNLSTLNLRQVSYYDEPWRNSLLEMLELRDQNEIRLFDFEQAVDQGSWSKSGRFRLLSDKKENLWCDCKVTLATESDSGCLVINYKKSSKDKEMKIMIFDITCVCRIYNRTFTNCFAIHTAVRTMERNSLVLSALSEKELNDWISSVTAACQRARKCEGPPKASAMWCTTSWGDVFFSDSKDESDFTSLPAYNIYWRQVGGHMKKVEAGIKYVVWGIGFDGKPWCFSRGFGGGIFSSQLSSAQGVYEQSDQGTFYTYENQRWNPLEGFGGRRLLSDRWEWSDETGVLERKKEGYPLPNSEWQWTDEWKVDFNTTEGTDKEGWMYALDFPRTYSSEKTWNDCVRRRRWLRAAKVNTTGPWIEVTPSIQLKDVSIQIDCKELVDGCVAVWAVNHKGDVLYRNGVTASCPQGKSWQHVTTNTQFVSISVGCNKNIWGVATDGAAYLRTGYEGNNELSKNWSRIPAPNHPFRSLSVGKNTIWAVDKFGEHYYREKVTDTFPEGTNWLRIFGRIDSVTVGPTDEVWVKCQGGLEKCFITNPEQPTGRGWVLALPDSWCSITARAIGVKEEEEEEKERVARGEAGLKQDPIEPVKQSSYKDLMESGDIYSIFGGEEDYRLPNSDSEGENEK